MNTKNSTRYLLVFFSKTKYIFQDQDFDKKKSCDRFFVKVDSPFTMILTHSIKLFYHKLNKLGQSNGQRDKV